MIVFQQIRLDGISVVGKEIKLNEYRVPLCLLREFSLFCSLIVVIIIQFDISEEHFSYLWSLPNFFSSPNLPWKVDVAEKLNVEEEFVVCCILFGKFIDRLSPTVNLT